MTHQITIKGEALPTSMFGTPYFWFDSLTGVEKINELFEYQLIVKIRDEYGNPAHGYAGLEGYVSPEQAKNSDTPASDLNLQSLIGTEIAVCMRLDGLKLDISQLSQINHFSQDHTYQNSINGARYFRGMVNKVEVLPVRNRHACYKITLVPWLWLLTKTTNYRIYQDESVTTILEDILLKYPYPVEYRISGNYVGLDYQVQYGESDFDFISRLMQEHGINYHFEEFLARKQKEMKALIDNGNVSVDEAMVGAAREWASIALPKGYANKFGVVSDGTISYYQSATNKAHVKTSAEVRAILEKIKKFHNK